VKERYAKVLSSIDHLQQSVRTICTLWSVKAHDTLVGAGTKVLSYLPAPIKTRIDTTYAKVGEVRVAIQHYVTKNANFLTQQFTNLAVSAKSRYAVMVSNVSTVIEVATVASRAKLEQMKAVAHTTMMGTWDRVPRAIKTRVSNITISATAKATAIREWVGVTWKYTSEDPKALATATATAGGAVAGGTTGFITGGAVGGLIGIIPAVFTFGLSIPLGAAIGSGIGLGCGAAAGGAAGLASGAVYANKAEMTRHASRCKDYVKDQASQLQDTASVSMSAVTRKLRRSGTGGTA
jgi:hypothetical protein